MHSDGDYAGSWLSPSKPSGRRFGRIRCRLRQFRVEWQIEPHLCKANVIKSRQKLSRQSKIVGKVFTVSRRGTVKDNKKAANLFQDLLLGVLLEGGGLFGLCAGYAPE